MTKGLSLGVALLLFVVGYLSHIVFVQLLLFVTFALSYVYSPRSYRVEGKTLVVNRLVGSVRISLENVRELRPTTKDDFRGGIRLWGSGGLFGYYGLFRTSRLGRCTFYVTNRKNTVVLVTDRKTILVSPDDVDGFLRAIEAVAPVIPRDDRAPIDALGSDRSALVVGAIAFVVAGLGILASVLAYAGRYAP
jgi:hypothetical protein